MPTVFQHTAARRRLGAFVGQGCRVHGFNTQPPEGGWENKPNKKKNGYRFQHTAARRRLVLLIVQILLRCSVSTHSRPKAAGSAMMVFKTVNSMFQHTAARRRLGLSSTQKFQHLGFQHTAARRRLGLSSTQKFQHLGFQHTAARRRLARKAGIFSSFHGFNTQPPEGGWSPKRPTKSAGMLFQHTAARRRLAASLFYQPLLKGFNTQPPEGGWQTGSRHIQKIKRFQHTAARRRLVSNTRRFKVI